MNEVDVISISGVPGSGTTTIAKLLSRELNLRLVYIGETFRELAKEYNMSLPEFGKYAQANSKIDSELDERQVAQARQGSVILEGRLSGWVLKNANIEALKVLLTASLDIRIKRVMDRESKSYDTVRTEILEREQVELERYQRLYGVNYQDTSHYDQIIDTSFLTPEEIVQRIIAEYEK